MDLVVDLVVDCFLSWCTGLCGSMISKAVLTGVHTPGGFNPVREALNESPDKSSPAFPDLQI